MPEFFSNQWMPFFWLILAIVLGVVEAASIQLVAIWFAIGAVVTIIPCRYGCIPVCTIDCICGGKYVAAHLYPPVC